MNPDGAVINRIEDRKNYIIRKSTNLSKEAHIIAANVDQAVLVVTVNHPVTSIVFIDRFLVSVEAYRIPVILVFNKIDAYSDDDLMLLGALTRIYEQVGYTCLHEMCIRDSLHVDIFHASPARIITSPFGHSFFSEFEITAG